MDLSVTDIVEKADKAMYRIKGDLKDGVCVEDPGEKYLSQASNVTALRRTRP
jgi:hypothetical protein